MLTKKLIQIISIPFFLFSLIGIFPVFLSLSSIIRDRDLLLNHSDYQKKHILIDSLIYNDNEGTNSSWVYGFSKDLNNYKTKIYFGPIKDDDLSKKLKATEEGDIYKYIWHRSGITKAYPGEKAEIKYPIKMYFYNVLKLPIIWMLCVLISYAFIRIKKRNKLLYL
ncbi:MAG: hypothetical protein V4670_02435 [Bacteroidota bacterium]